MLELGQPLHAFDFSRIAGSKIVVRRANEGETIKTLDGVERKLGNVNLLICDADRPRAIAGVMGGEEGEITSSAETVLLESALFDPATVKHSATSVSLQSEAAYRYIRGVDKDLADFASMRAAHLLQKYASAKVLKGAVDVDNRPAEESKGVELRFDALRKLIGIDIDNKRAVDILKGLGLKVIGSEDVENAASVSFEIPSWRYDLEREADLVEEIARLNGLDAIPDTMPSAPSVSNLDETPFRAKKQLRAICLSLGFTEAMHYSFLSERELDAFDSSNREERLVIPDPVSAEYGVMRPSLLAQLYSSLGRNASYQAESAMLFEMGKVFSSKGGTPSEEERLSLGFFGPVGRESLRKRAPLGEEEALSWMKGTIERIISGMHAGKVVFQPSERAAFEKGATLAIILNGREVGVMGAVTPKMRHPYRMTTQMVLCEMQLPCLLKRYNATGKVSAPPQFPLVRRDISVVLKDNSVTHGQIMECIVKSGGKLLSKTELFDIFKIKGAGKSLAYSLEFRSPERTLTDDEVANAFTKIVEALKSVPGVEVREG
jgi:phenylalanyl-tRNA synthetase beta chain